MMPKPLHPLPDAPSDGSPPPHELDLEAITAGGYFTIGRHTFMVERMNLTSVARSDRHGKDAVREPDEIDLRLVHLWWKCCDA